MGADFGVVVVVVEAVVEGHLAAAVAGDSYSRIDAESREGGKEKSLDDEETGKPWGRDY